MSDKVIKIIGYVILGVTILIGLLFFIIDAPALNTELAISENLPQDVKILETEKIASNWTGFIMTYAYILLIGCAVVAVGFAIYKFIENAIDNPKSAIKPLVSVVIVAIVVLISYFLGSDSMLGLGHIKEPLISTTAKLVDSSIYLMYIFVALPILAIVYSSISRIWK